MARKKEFNGGEKKKKKRRNQWNWFETVRAARDSGVKNLAFKKRMRKTMGRKGKLLIGKRGKGSVL